MDLLASFTAILLSGTLLLSGASKVFSPTLFAESVGGVLGPALPEALPIKALTRGIGGLEILVSVLLAFPSTAAVGSATAGLLGISFVLWATVAMVRGVQVACGCFGSARSSPLGPRNIAAGVLIAALSAFTLFIPGRDIDPPTILLLACLLSLVAAIVPVSRDMFGILRRGLSWR